jgi:hypothetical protein
MSALSVSNAAGGAIAMALPTNIHLTLDLAGCPTKLQQTLLPLLQGQSAPLRAHIPSFRRSNGSWSQPFDFVVALRNHPEPRFQKLFPYRLSSTQLFGWAQREAWEEMSEADKRAYAMLYSKEEWRTSYKASRNVGKAKSKAAGKNRQKSSIRMPASERSSALLLHGAVEPRSRGSECVASEYAELRVTNPKQDGTMVSSLLCTRTRQSVARQCGISQCC